MFPFKHLPVVNMIKKRDLRRVIHPELSKRWVYIGECRFCRVSPFASYVNGICVHYVLHSKTILVIGLNEHVSGNVGVHTVNCIIREYRTNEFFTQKVVFHAHRVQVQSKHYLLNLRGMCCLSDSTANCSVNSKHFST